MPAVAKAPKPMPNLGRPGMEVTLQRIAVKDIQESLNHRIDKADDEAKIKELQGSIGPDGTGLLSPIKVWKPASQKGYRLVFGHRRMEAHRRNKVPTILALVASAQYTPDQEITERAIENLQRDDLDPSEEAVAVADLLDANGGDVEKAANTIGKPVRWVQDRKYIQRLSKPVRAMLAGGQITISQAVKKTRAEKPSAQEGDGTILARVDGIIAGLKGKLSKMEAIRQMLTEVDIALEAV